MTRVNLFISHASEDSRVAMELARSFEHSGYTTWYYERDSLAGIPYLSQYTEAIDRSDAVLLLISSHALESIDVIREAEIAHGRFKEPRLIPVLLNADTSDVKRHTVWRALIGTSAAIAHDDVATTVARLAQSLTLWGIAPHREPSRSSIDDAQGPSGTHAWATDAVQINVKDLERLVSCRIASGYGKWPSGSRPCRISRSSIPRTTATTWQTSRSRC